MLPVVPVKCAVPTLAVCPTVCSLSWLDLRDQWDLLVTRGQKDTLVFVGPEEKQVHQEKTDFLDQMAEKVDEDHEENVVHVQMELSLKDRTKTYLFPSLFHSPLQRMHQKDHQEYLEHLDQVDHMDPLEVLVWLDNQEQWENQVPLELWAHEVKMELTVFQEVEESQDQAASKGNVVYQDKLEFQENQENVDTRE